METVPHVVILDLQMPVMDGFEAAQAIRKHNSTRPPLLVALSGSSQLVKLAAAGTVFDHALRKPASVEPLIALATARRDDFRQGTRPRSHPVDSRTSCGNALSQCGGSVEQHESLGTAALDPSVDHVGPARASPGAAPSALTRTSWPR